MLGRRSFLTNLACAALVPATAVLPAMLPTSGFANTPNRAGSRLDSLVRDIEPVLEIYNTNTKERAKFRFYRSSGYNMDAVREFNWIMRDWRQQETRQMDIRLLWGLAALRMSGIKAGNPGLIHANSGFRTNKTNDFLRARGYGAAKKSLHLEAKAVDFTMPGAKVSDLAEIAEWLEIGGTGHYRNRFVHIDSGPKRKWYG